MGQGNFNFHYENSPRSSHKLLFDYKMKRIYTFGRYIDIRDNIICNSDFYYFDIIQNKWILLSNDTTVN
jgi:uncharacterized protein YhbP (UPF0306 family)